MNAPILQIKDLKKQYDGKQVLRISQLDILPGEIFVLIGPSGAGKSTLLRLLNFLEPPDQGEIIFKGKRFNATTQPDLEQRRKITTLFQRPMLFNRSVLANVTYGLSLRGERHPVPKAQAALERVGLGTSGKQNARTLSGGEAQRAALARAMVLEPEVLLLDEPTANLDPYNVSIIEGMVRNLALEQGTTIVLVTHNIFQARRLAERAGLLLHGDLIDVGEADDFFETPQDPRAASFLRGELVID
jgi:tungstate transport system ATP-binding protein